MLFTRALLIVFANTTNHHAPGRFPGLGEQPRHPSATTIHCEEPDRPICAAQVRRLKVGSARHFSTTTRESLVADLHRVLTPHYVIRAREIATQMTKSALQF